jgi:hypothetical protein
MKLDPMSAGPVCVAALLSASVPLTACRDETCGDCRDEKCSDLVSHCNTDPDCKCMAGCLGDEGIPGVEGCLASCGLTAHPAAFVPVEECVAIACPDEDECSTPSDYTPPEIPSADDTSALEAQGGGGDLADCSFDDSLSFDPEGPVLQLESANGNVCLRLERRDLGSGNLANTKWELLEMRVGPLGGVALVDDPADLCWYSSHHNFLDWAYVWTGSARYDLKLREYTHGGARNYALHPYEQGQVDPVSCGPSTDATEPIGDPITIYPFEP